MIDITKPMRTRKQHDKVEYIAKSRDYSYPYLVYVGVSDKVYHMNDKGLILGYDIAENVPEEKWVYVNIYSDFFNGFFLGEPKDEISKLKQSTYPLIGRIRINLADHIGKFAE